MKPSKNISETVAIYVFLDTFFFSFLGGENMERAVQLTGKLFGINQNLSWYLTAVYAECEERRKETMVEASTYWGVKDHRWNVVTLV